MLTEVAPTTWQVRVQGRVVAANVQSKPLAEHIVMSLPPEQRHLAEIVPTTSDGKTVLFG